MNNIRCPWAPQKLIISLQFLILMFMLLSCTERPIEPSARSGVLTVAVDRQLESAAAMQSEVFSRYYPDARITIFPAASVKTIMHLLDQKAGAALINGDLQAAEDSLVATMKLPLRREPVGRDAIVCIVNRQNPVKSLSINELSLLYTRSGSDATPLVTADDYRLMTSFAGKIGKKKQNLHAWASKSDSELIRRVAADRKAVGLLFLSSFNAVPGLERERNNIRIVPLAREASGERASLPTRQNIFDNRYPLVTTVYYVYYAGNALAAGFGSWLASSGQKGIERSSLVPFRLIERTIILK
jgi:phosphate transport system substrate-binding protein